MKRFVWEFRSIVYSLLRQLVLGLIHLLQVIKLECAAWIGVLVIGLFVVQLQEQERGYQLMREDNMPSELTKQLMNYEGYRSRPYRLGKESSQTIGYGHYLDNPSDYATLADKLEFKDKNNLSKSEALTLLMHDVQIRRNEMQSMYPDTDPELLEIMGIERFRWSPEGFDKMYGNALRRGDVNELKRVLSIVGDKAKRDKMGGVSKRTNDVIAQLNKYKGAS